MADEIENLPPFIPSNPFTPLSFFCHTQPVGNILDWVASIPGMVFAVWLRRRIRNSLASIVIYQNHSEHN